MSQQGISPQTITIHQFHYNAAGEDAIDFTLVDAGVFEGVEGSLGVQLEDAFVRDDADLVGLVGANDGDALQPAGGLARVRHSGSTSLAGET